MLKETFDTVVVAERTARQRGLGPALKLLRRLPVPDFGRVLLEMPHSEFPTLSALLPKMATSEVQQRWTGGSGQPLLNDSVTFMRLLCHRFEELAGRSINGATVLDFGCGYGRLLRLLSYYIDPEKIYGVDPNEQSIALCQADGVLGTIAQSDYLPKSLPVGEIKFDLIYAYSVFTHLSARAVRSAMETLRQYIEPDGVFALTVRPVDYWDQIELDASIRERLQSAHRQEGLAFIPHGVAPVDGDITYGDTSIDPQWLATAFPEWSLRGYDRGLDLYQTVLLLGPA